MCPDLCATRTGIVESISGSVTGRQPAAATLMLLCEAPGQEEDRDGIPLVGRAGKIARDAVSLAGVKPQGIVYANAVRCWPGRGNRDPSSQEIENCRMWLELDVALYRPAIVLVAGKIAARAITPLIADGVLELGQVRYCDHPAYVLRMPRFRERFQQAVFDAAVDAGVSSVPMFLRPGGPRPPAAPAPFVIRRDGDGGLRYYPFSTEWSAVDVETTGEESGDTVGWSFATRNFAFFTTRPISLPAHVYLHGAIHDIPRLGINPRQLESWDCTLLMAYVLRYPELSLQAIGRQLTGLTKRSYADLMQAAKDTWNSEWSTVPPVPPNTVPDYVQDHLNKRNLMKGTVHDFRVALFLREEEAVDYAAKDSLITSRVAAQLVPQLEANPPLEKYYRLIEKPLLPVLLDMQRNGCRVNPDRLSDTSKYLQAIETSAIDGLQRLLSNADFNPHSPDQVSAAFLTDSNLSPRGLKVSPLTGSISTGESQLLRQTEFEKFEQFETEIERRGARTAVETFVYGVLKARKARKLRGTYADRLLRDRDGDSRIHTTYNQTVTITNRLSSSDPNLQNVPGRTELGRTIRRAFEAEPGFVLVRYDWSQVEVRIFAEYTQDPFLIEAYAREARGEDVDIHDFVREMLGLPAGKRGRDIAKNFVFATIYGAAGEKAGEVGGLSKEEAEDVQRLFKAKMPSVTSWAARVRRELEARGYLETLLGWRCYFPLYWSPLYSEQQDALRSAANFPIQGTAAGLYKQWLLYAAQIMPVYGARPVLTVYDELVVETPDNPEKVGKMTQEMITAARVAGARWGLTVPMRLSAEVGPNWADMQPFGTMGVS